LPILTRYEVLEEVGRGGMGVVYRGRHRLLDKPVAIKVCIPGQEIERFQREAKLLASIRSPFAVPVHDFDLLPDGRAMLVMEWIAGRDLRQLLHDADHPFPEGRVLPWMLQVCDGMQAVAAQGIVHRDLKPSNILVDEQDQAHVVDFGLARPARGEPLTLTGGMMGTPHYMAPEQAEDPRGVDTRADVYSFGATFYHVLTGQPPFRGETAFSILYKHKTEPLVPPRSRNPGVSAWTNDLIERCLAKAPADRFSSFAELRKHLRSGLDASSPWTSSDDGELEAYLARYRARRASYLAEQRAWDADLDVYTFPNGQALRVRRGDLVAQRVDAVVSSDTCYLRMEWGVSAALRQAAGEAVAREALRQAPVRPGRAVVTSGGILPARLIFHGVTVGIVKDELVRPSRDLIAEIMASCFYHADSHDVRSIAFPLLGTGAMQFPRDVCLDTMFQFLARMFLRGLTSVREAQIVLFVSDR
jgi:O-acetyl-ADP-ribose deacetylase (regulator of RNase III)/predicted Ser/Thr protein kinase